MNVTYVCPPVPPTSRVGPTAGKKSARFALTYKLVLLCFTKFYLILLVGLFPRNLSHTTFATVVYIELYFYRLREISLLRD